MCFVFATPNAKTCDCLAVVTTSDNLRRTLVILMIGDEDELADIRKGIAQLDAGISARPDCTESHSYSSTETTTTTPRPCVCLAILDQWPRRCLDAPGTVRHYS